MSRRSYLLNGRIYNAIVIGSLQRYSHGDAHEEKKKRLDIVENVWVEVPLFWPVFWDFLEDFFKAFF